MEKEKSTSNYRTIKSYVLRGGRITASQQYALEHTWKLYGIAIKEKIVIDFHKIFVNNNPITLEIGFGNGDSLIAMAKANPELNFVGVEVYKAGIGRLLQNIANNNLSNLKVIWHDAVEVLTNNIADNSLSCVQVFFPDPWSKRKHHKRRIINKEFVELISKKLMSNGVLHMATDWEHYALEMQRTLADSSNFIYVNRYERGSEDLINNRFPTKFEKKGILKGHGIWDFKYANLR